MTVAMSRPSMRDPAIRAATLRPPKYSNRKNVGQIRAKPLTVIVADGHPASNPAIAHGHRNDDVLPVGGRLARVRPPVPVVKAGRMAVSRLESA